ncbi:MAG: hypothetical protein F6J95_013655 [Leptolyngbya sp. SIO1E4]|nr:hypothetical protein [Leptolyngbya sp. SIO1E4]
MPWTALILFGLAIAAWRFTQNHPDDVGRFLGSLSALVCLIAGLATAPLLLRSIILLGLLVYPDCSSQLELRQQPNCPRLCVFRGQCRPSLQQRFSPNRR